MADTTDEKAPEAGGAVAAINRYRDLAKWLIAVFAAVGGLLVAGSQLSTLGKLDLEDDLIRLVAAFLGLALALLSTMWLVSRALSILKPVEMSAELLVTDGEVNTTLNAMPSSLPFGAGSVTEVRDRLADALENPFLTPEQKDVWRAQVIPLVDYASYLKIEKRFESVWRDMAKAGMLAALGIFIFAYAANPPAEEAAAAAATTPTPTPGTISLTATGREALKDQLGATCVAGTPKAIAIGGTSSAPEVVTGSDGCKAARFTLSADWGAWRRDTSAPTE